MSSSSLSRSKSATRAATRAWRCSWFLVTQIWPPDITYVSYNSGLRMEGALAAGGANALDAAGSSDLS